MKQTKNKGITLIALIITIIILIILAGVSISALTENGLIRKTMAAREKAKISEYVEAINLAQTEGIMTDYYPDNTQESILNKIKNILNQQELFNGSDYEIAGNTLTIITSDEYVFEVTADDKGNIQIKYVSELDKTEPTIKITVTDYNGVYDGNPHSATVSSAVDGTIFTYGTTEGSYTLSSMPSYTDAGTYTVYWKASKDDYTIDTGSVTVKIEKANSTISLSASNGYITVTTNSDGDVSATSSNSDIADLTVSGKSVRVVPVTNGSAGTFTATVSVNESTNYKASASATQSVTVSSRLITSYIGWYNESDYWSGCYRSTDDSNSKIEWYKDTDSMWRTTANITLTDGCYYIIGDTGGRPRAVIWNDSTRASLYKAFTAYNGETITVSGTKYLQIPILVKGVTSTKPVDYTSYDVRKITFD